MNTASTPYNIVFIPALKRKRRHKVTRNAEPKEKLHGCVKRKEITNSDGNQAWTSYSFTNAPKAKKSASEKRSILREHAADKCEGSAPEQKKRRVYQLQKPKNDVSSLFCSFNLPPLVRAEHHELSEKQVIDLEHEEKQEAKMKSTVLEYQQQQHEKWYQQEQNCYSQGENCQQNVYSHRSMHHFYQSQEYQERKSTPPLIQQGEYNQYYPSMPEVNSGHIAARRERISIRNLI